MENTQTHNTMKNTATFSVRTRPALTPADRTTYELISEGWKVWRVCYRKETAEMATNKLNALYTEWGYH